MADSGESNVSVLINDGNGGFGTLRLIGVGWTPTLVAAADINGDGLGDIVTGSGPSYNVSVLLGTGNGGFQTPETYAISGAPIALVATNLDGGALDLAVATQSDNGRVSILENARLDAVAFALPPLIVGSAAHLAVHADGYGELTYQWKKNGIPLSDGGPISGSSTSTLTIDPVSFLDATAAYDFVITDWCTSLEATFPGFSVEFDDVPLTSPFHADIIRIATLGITAGCNSGTSFCPSAPVSRAEMAVFLLKSKYGASHVPPPPPVDPIFADVPADAFAAAWIDELSTLGVTAGCGNGDYCPNDPVTRGQMAVFLLKTLLGSGYVPPPATGIFADVPPDHFAIDWIEDLYNRGITAGCGTNPLRYCPDADVPGSKWPPSSSERSVSDDGPSGLRSRGRGRRSPGDRCARACGILPSRLVLAAGPLRRRFGFGRRHRGL